MTTCLIVGMIITCTNVAPLTPERARNVLVQSIRPWTAPPPPVDPSVRYAGATSYNPAWPFLTPPSPPRISTPWSVTVVAPPGYYASWFNGSPTGGYALFSSQAYTSLPHRTDLSSRRCQRC
jgi:hypothetical protein